MNRKLVALNVVLVLVAAYAGYLFRNEWKASKAREAGMKNEQVKAAPVPPLAPVADQPPVMATNYKEVAMKTLFHPSRNPDLPPPVIEPPPPPKPMPALPKYHGTMNLGEEGPTALLSIGANPSSQEIKIGDQIGPFKLVDFNTVDMTFDWDGTTVRRTLDQLSDRSNSASANNSGGGDDGGNRSVASAPPPVAAPVIKQPMGPQGEPTAFGFKECSNNDTLPDGTVQGGYRKVSYKTPFGSGCRWDPVGR